MLAFLPHSSVDLYYLFFILCFSCIYLGNISDTLCLPCQQFAPFRPAVFPGLRRRSLHSRMTKLSHYMMSRLTPHKGLFYLFVGVVVLATQKASWRRRRGCFNTGRFTLYSNTLTIGSTLPSVYVPYPCRNAMHIIGLFYLFTVLFSSLYCRVILGWGFWKGKQRSEYCDHSKGGE